MSPVKALRKIALVCLLNFHGQGCLAVFRQQLSSETGAAGSEPVESVGVIGRPVPLGVWE